ncbi:MAG: ABC transporter permease [Gemmataceae bacterium]|nr:ABC transporter permease [Gemmataceae bacterium]
MIPIKYNLRNLRVRWVTTLMTSLFTGLLVCASVLVFGLVDGLMHAFTVSADEQKLLVLRKGSDNEISSSIDGETARNLKNLPGIAVDSATGVPMWSAESVTIQSKARRGDTIEVNLIVRGLTQEGRTLRPGFRIVAGRDLRPGTNEAITSPSMAARFQDCGLGERLNINGADFEIVGLFETNGSTAESEVWTDWANLNAARKRPEEIYSLVMLQAASPSARDAIVARVKSSDDEFKELEVKNEKEYYQSQAEAMNYIKWVGYILAIFLSLGASFGAANTMYAAVAARAREIGTLRALGFGRRSILMSFLLESVMLCLIGGIVGCLVTVPLNGMSSGTQNAMMFSEVTFSFHFGPRVLLQGILLATFMGLLGGFAPALRAVRISIVQALRER